MSVFSMTDVQALLRDKFVVVLGGSVQRGVYKDLVAILSKPGNLPEAALRNKGEESFLDDQLVAGGCIEGMHNGTSYREVRHFNTDHHQLKFYFLTKCYNEYVETVLEELVQEGTGPDVLIMNSCLWDLTRYGHNGRQQYRKNLRKLFDRMTEILPPTTLVLWLTAPPVGAKVRGGVFLPHLAYFQETIRYDVAEANYQAHEIACEYDIDVLDLHYYFRGLNQLRVKDGIHWNSQGHRKMTYLILSHLSIAWGVPLPLTKMPPPPMVPVQGRRPLRALNPSNVSAEERYGGPIKPAAFLMPAPVPHRRHVRSGSCDPAMLGSSMAPNYGSGMGREERYGYPGSCGFNISMGQMQAMRSSWVPYEQAPFQPTMGQMARRQGFHPYYY